MDKILEITSKNSYLRGREYYFHKRVKRIDMEYRGDDISVDSYVTGNGADYDVHVDLDRVSAAPLYYSCTCPASMEYFGPCKHIIATLLALKAQQESDRTDRAALDLINSYARRVTVESYTEGVQEKINIVPELNCSYRNEVYLGFKLGRQKLYIMKDPGKFVEHMKASEKAAYGKKLEFIHARSSFAEDSCPILDFIMNHYPESEALIYRNYYSGRDRRQLCLSAAMLDEFFEIYEGRAVSIELRRLPDGLYTPEKSNPELTAEITPINDDKSYSISLYGEKIELLSGARHMYVVRGETVHICDEEYTDKLYDFLSAVTVSGKGQLIVGKKDMRAFYTSVIEPIGRFIEIKADEDLSEFQSVPLVARLYLDAPTKSSASAQLEFNYGEEKYPAYEKRQISTIGDMRTETVIKAIMARYFDLLTMDRKTLFFEDDDDKLYRLVSEGIPELSEYCEIFMTDKFRRIGIRQPPSVSVGVRLESDLVNLSIDMGDIDIEDLTEILRAYKLAKKYHRLRDGSFVDIGGSSLAEISALADGLNLSDKDILKEQIKVPKYRVLYLDSMIKQGGELQYERNSEFKRIVRDIKGVSDSELEVPPELDGILRNYQKTGYCWLKTMSIYNFGGILADDMGLGKTLQVIALIKSYKDQGGTLPTLVVCPSSLVLNWESEIDKFSPSLKTLAVTGTSEVRKELIAGLGGYDVIITSYDMLKRDVASYSGVRFEFEIIDEAQYIKNHSTQNAKAVKLINSGGRFALTGTPVENSLAELWSVFDFLMPGYLYAYTKFKQRFEKAIVKSKDEDALENLRKMVSPFILRRMKKDVLKELPEKTETVLYASLEGEQQKLYIANAARIKSELSQQFEEKGFDNSKLMVLAMLTRLRQLCCDPSLMYEDYHGESAKLDMCMELVKSSVESGHKLLLFSQFTSMLAIIEMELTALGLPYYKIEGATKAETRLSMVNKFNADKTPVFLISLKAGGTGLNLTGADVVIHYDPWWNVSAQNQATDRAHRIGQKNSVSVYKLIAKNTIEEKILKLQESKAELADMIINGSEGSITKMSRAEIMELFD